MANIIEARVKQKVATEAEWLTFDLIPLEGEQCFVKDSMGNNIGFKLGNGVARYSELPMWSTAGAVYLSDLADVGSMSVSEGDLFSFVSGRWNAISGNSYVKPDGANASGTWGINISGNANSATYWGSLPADFVTDGVNLTRLIGRASETGGGATSFSNTQVQSWLGIPSGGETLQSVTDRGNSTTNNILINNTSNPRLGIRNGLTEWNNYINSDGTYIISESTVGDWVSILKGGNVGIGTSTPVTGSKLNVAGNVQIDNELTLGYEGDTNFIGSRQVNQNLRVGGTNQISLQTYDGDWRDRIMILNNGNVGIGTASPSEKLDVNGKGKFLGLDSGSELIVPTSAPSAPISGKTYLWVS